MSAYAVVHMRQVTIGQAIVEYLQRIDATLAPFGGQFIVHGGEVEVQEGSCVAPALRHVLRREARGRRRCRRSSRPQ
jgi:uncharacterized protein (DUF1330 family)